VRETVLSKMKALGAEESHMLPVREFQEMGQSQQSQAFGEALPVGLRLVIADDPGSEAS